MNYQEKYKKLLEEFETYKEESIKWSVEDFTSLEKDGYQITDDNAKQALNDMIRHHDCNYGITWDTVNYYFDKYADAVEEGTELWRTNNQ